MDENHNQKHQWSKGEVNREPLLPVRTKPNPSHRFPALPNPLDTSFSTLPSMCSVTCRSECSEERSSSQQPNFKRHQQLLVFLFSQVGTSWTEKQIWINRENRVGEEAVGEVLVNPRQPFWTTTTKVTVDVKRGYTDPNNFSTPISSSEKGFHKTVGFGKPMFS